MTTAHLTWDTWGIPHIDAPDEQGAAYSLGWAQARAHGDVVLRLMGQARGRAAEYWGQNYLPGDRLVAAMGFDDPDGRWSELCSARTQQIAVAFAAGVNSACAAHADAARPELRRALPITARDVLAHLRRVMFTFQSLNGLLWGGIDPMQLPDVMSGLPLMPEPPGSNAWALGPARSTSDKAMLLINPHIGWRDLYTMFEVHLRTPQLDVSGMCLVGFPAISMGFNSTLGWAHTVNVHRGWDLFQLTPAGAGYLLDGQEHAFDERPVTLRVRNEDGSLSEHPHTVRRSLHGPVIGQNDIGPLAVRVAGVDALPAPDGLEQYWDMAAAGNRASFEAALARLQLPMFTVVYADSSGNILSLFGGITPRRRDGGFADYCRVLPGDDSAFIWTEALSYEELPRVTNPDGGWVQNSNSPPWFAAWPPTYDRKDFPAYLSSEFLTLREQRGIEMLQQGPYDLDSLWRAKFDRHVTLADRVLDDLLAAAKAAEDETLSAAISVLGGWDRHVHPDSRGAVLFTTWVQCTGALPPLALDLFAVPWNRDEPFETPRGLRNAAAAVEALRQAITLVKSSFGSIDPAWGDVCRLRRGSADLPGAGGPGDPLGIFQAVTYQPGGDAWLPTGGDTVTYAIEFSNPPRAIGVCAYGNASREGSPHTSDQIALYATARGRPVLRDPDDIREAAREHEHLVLPTAETE